MWTGCHLCVGWGFQNARVPEFIQVWLPKVAHSALNENELEERNHKSAMRKIREEVVGFISVEGFYQILMDLIYGNLFKLSGMIPAYPSHSSFCTCLLASKAVPCVYRERVPLHCTVCSSLYMCVQRRKEITIHKAFDAQDQGRGGGLSIVEEFHKILKRQISNFHKRSMSTLAVQASLYGLSSLKSF